jgi:hypothetical protein
MPTPFPIKIRTRETQLRNGCKTSGLAKTRVAQSLAVATFPQIQALRSPNSRNCWIASMHCPIDSRHMVPRLAYMEISSRVAIWIDKSESVDERIRRNGFAAVPALELGFLRAFQGCLEQQRRAAGCSSRLDRTVLTDSERHCHIAGDVCHSRNRWVYRRRQFAKNDVSMLSVGKTRILRRRICNEHGQKRHEQSQNRQQPAPFHMADSILNKTLKLPSGEFTR